MRLFYFNMVVLVVLHMAGVCNDRISADDSVAQNATQELWKNKIRGKDTALILDDAEVIKMFLFSAQKNTGISPRAASITSVMFCQDAPQATKGALAEALLLKRARELKGSELTSEELNAIKSLHNKISREYASSRPSKKPGAFVMDITFGLGMARNLQRTIKNAKTFPEALEMVLKSHGYKCTYFYFNNVSIDKLKECIDRKIPVILEKDKEFYICFGYINEEGGFRIIISEPINTPFSKVDIVESKVDIESMHPGVVASRKSRHARKGKFKKFNTDYKITMEKQIPKEGFYIEPFSGGKYKAHILMNWRRSAEGHDQKLKQILKLPEDIPEQSFLLPENPKDKDLWSYYILGRREGISGNYALVPSVIFPMGRQFNMLYACFLSSIATQRGDAVGHFSIRINKLYKLLCKIFDDPFLILKKDQLTLLEKFHQKIKKRYDYKQFRMDTYCK